MKRQKNKIGYDTITTWDVYEWQCEMGVIYSAYKVEQINDYTYS